MTADKIDALVREHLLVLTEQANRLPKEKRIWGSLHRVCLVEMRDVARALCISRHKVDDSMTRLSCERDALITKIGYSYSLNKVNSHRSPGNYVMGVDWAVDRPLPERLGRACFVWCEEKAPKKKRYSKRLQRRIN